MPKLSRSNYESDIDLDSNSDSSQDGQDSVHSGDDSFIDNTSQVQGDGDPFPDSDEEFEEVNADEDSIHEGELHTNEPEHDDARPPPIKKPRKSTKKTSGGGGDPPNPDNNKPPGHPSFPITGWSVTVSKTKCDVSVSLLSIFHNWISAFCLRGAAATEVGKRAFNFHLQSKLSFS